MNSSNYDHHRKVSRLLSLWGLRIVPRNRWIWLASSDLEHIYNAENINDSDLKSWHPGPRWHSLSMAKAEQHQSQNIMDTRDQARTKLTRLHDEYHPTPHRPASLRRNYSLPVWNIMELAMKEGWWWRRSKIPLSRALNGLQIWPPDKEQEVAATPTCETR